MSATEMVRPCHIISSLEGDSYYCAQVYFHLIHFIYNEKNITTFTSFSDIYFMKYLESKVTPPTHTYTHTFTLSFFFFFFFLSVRRASTL